LEEKNSITQRRDPTGIPEYLSNIQQSFVGNPSGHRW
jgi:hypothetical protein